jgi:very-short-patch-repair endonuclease/predicted transcriptional regulator of viral defense system
VLCPVTTGQSTQDAGGSVWTLARRQHGVVSRAQLLALGYSRHAIQHRVATGRLDPTWRGVYAVGRPQLTQRGRWLAAVLSCGQRAALSHESAAVVWRIVASEPREVHVSLPAPLDRRRPGIVVHRREGLEPRELTTREGIPVTTPDCTLIDLAARPGRERLEVAINQASKLGLIELRGLHERVRACPRRPGAAALAHLIDRATFALTDSRLERRFLPIVRRTGLPMPDTQKRVSGFRVDFVWRALGLVVETDGGSYHRTPFQQTSDRVRDQAHLVAGLTPLRFTHAQVAFEPDRVATVLAAVARRLAAEGQGPVAGG